MTRTGLPRVPSEVLDIPPQDVPEVIRSLLRKRSMSTLVADIHCEMRSPDPKLRAQAVAALRHLGFPDT